MPNYQNGKIYTIRCYKDDSKIYVGSTTTTLSRRIAEHRSTSANKEKTKTRWYNEIEDWGDWYIELYEDCPCENKEQLCKREGEIIREIGNLNKKIAGRTAKEWGKDNPDKLKATRKKYHENNPEKVKATSKKYHENHKEERLEVNKKWMENNKEHRKEYKKAYREANKEKIAEYRAKYWLNVEVANKDEINHKQRENYAKRQNA
jgi:hypothetical protein